MQNTTAFTPLQLTPRDDELTGMAAAIAAADLGRRVLYIPHGRKAGRRLVAYDPRAAFHDKVAGSAEIVVLMLHQPIPEDVQFDVLVADVLVGGRTARDQWRDVVENAGIPNVLIAQMQDQRAALSLAISKASAERSASTVGGSKAQAWGKDDDKLWGHWLASRRSWSVGALYPGAQEVDLQAEVDGLNRFQIAAAADLLWVDEARTYGRTLALTNWAQRNLLDEDILFELKYLALTTLRCIYDAAWAKDRQLAQLHDEHEEDYRLPGSDVYAMDRGNLATRREYVMQILTDLGWAAQMEVGQPVTFDRTATPRLRRALRALFIRSRWHAIDSLDPNNGAIAKAMLEEPDPNAEPDIRLTISLMKRLGYCEVSRRTISSAAGRSSSGKKKYSRRQELTYGPRVPFRLGGPGSTGTIPGFQTSASASSKGDNKEDASADIQNPPKTQVQPGPPSPDGLIPGFSLDLRDWQTLGAPVDKGDGYDRQTVYATVPKFAHDGVLYIPDPAKRRPAVDKYGRCYSRWPGTQALIHAVSKTHRAVLHALPGRTLLNFDFSNAHVRIAAKLAENFDVTKEFRAMAAADDVYSSVSQKLGVSRAHAKLLVLILLNGGANVADHCPKDWTKAQVDAHVAEFRRIAKPWVSFYTALNKEDPLPTKYGPTSDRQRGAFELQRRERRLLDAVLKDLEKTAPHLRLIVTMYDGAVFDIESTDQTEVDTAKNAITSAVRRVTVALGYTNIAADVGSGKTWAEAEGS